MKNLFLLALLCFATNLYSQNKAGNIWYFADHAGLDFNTNPPTALADGQQQTREGTSCIADPLTGSLLFYSDGITVWDRNHQVMPGSKTTPLAGSLTSVQSALIVPLPGSTRYYYVFTTPGMLGIDGNTAMCYSIVDMSLNGGNGDLAVINIPLIDSSTEKVTAVATDCNDTAFWIAGHRWNSDTFYTFHLTKDGLSAPVKSKVGIVHYDANEDGVPNEVIGYMKFSPGGRYLANTMTSSICTMELFDFDLVTGKISNPRADNFLDKRKDAVGLYGCSFSPDESKFYLCYVNYRDSSSIYQYNMNAGDIIGSRNLLKLFTKTGMQNGPDGKLYLCSYGDTELHVIQNPNEWAEACNYVVKGQLLSYKTDGAKHCLPGMVESFVRFRSIPRVETICAGDTFVMKGPPQNITSVSPSSFSINTDTSLIRFFPNSATTYTITSRNKCGFIDTIHLTINFHRPVAEHLSQKICWGDTLRIGLNSRNIVSVLPGSYFLNSDSSQIYVLPKDSTIYTVLSLNGCRELDTLYLAVAVLPVPVANFSFSPATPTIADAELKLINESSDGDHYKWYQDKTKIGDGMHCSVFISDTGTFCYTLVAFSKEECTDTTRQCVNIVRSTIGIPNSFTPNRDGKNDGFRAIVSGPYRSFKMLIYNRYGEQIFSADKPEQAWDGTYKNQEQELGVYYYLVKVKFGGTDAKEELYKGDVTLIR